MSRGTQKPKKLIYLVLEIGFILIICVTFAVLALWNLLEKLTKN